jgi:hypothetical protein
MRVKTSELTGTALDWAVAKCEGLLAFGYEDDMGLLKITLSTGDTEYFIPTMKWEQGGPIIEREKLGVWFSDEVHDEDGNILREVCWYCETSCTTDNGDEPYQFDTGATPLIAAKRCYVASKLGEEIEIPEVLWS